MWIPFRRGSGPAGGLDPQVALLPPAGARYVVIDLELTGLDERADSILSLGGVRVASGRIDLQDTFYEEVRPASALTASSIVVHGITPDQVRERPGIATVLADFLAFCGRDIVVGHFISIDLGFIRKELAGAPGACFDNPVIDTGALYEWLESRPPADGERGLQPLRDPRLYELARSLGVVSRGAHNALGDAFITAQVFQRLLRLCARWRLGTTADLVRAGDPRGIASHRHGTAPPLT